MKTLNSIAETHALAAVVATHAPWGSCIGLSGELGAGKTEFVKGFAVALGIREPVTSPTFVLEAQYPIRRDNTRGILHHWDLYRLGKANNVPDLEEEISRENSLVIVEWPEKVLSVDNLLSVKIMIDSPPLCAPESSGQMRKFQFLRAPEVLQTALKEFFKETDACRKQL